MKFFFFFFSSRRRHTRLTCDWSSDVCSSDLELPAASGPDAKDREAERILAKRLPRGELWALDERGTQTSSVDLSGRIARLRDSALDLTLCAGGDEGLGPAVAREARFTWSLSRLTLPHRLARVVALEQLYRAFEILRGAPYHK